MKTLEQLIKRKLEYPGLNRLVSNELLQKSLDNDISMLDDGQLTLLNCLASNNPDPFPPIPILRALDNNLQELQKVDAIWRPGELAQKLLNKHLQFLNTLSELALARELSEQGWGVKLEEKFFGKKDVDIFAERDGEENFIEVINLAPKERDEDKYSGMVSSTGMVSAVGERDGGFKSEVQHPKHQ
ncbi:hypothetical protein ACH518_15245 [Methylomonas sp. HW2-6]|uniref:hypothetical protein n=1 Tax=Methylomonas sp. HW2-6 TaxID=3376687 RepID=UPI0040436753